MIETRETREASCLFLHPRGVVPARLREIGGRSESDDDAIYLFMVAQILDEHEAAPPPSHGWRYRARQRRTSWVERLGMRLMAAVRGEP